MSKATEPPDPAAVVLTAIERLLRPGSTVEVLDGLAEQSAHLAGYRTSELIYVRPHGTWIGSFNRTSEEVAGLKRLASRESLAQRAAERIRIKRSAFAETGIAYARHEPVAAGTREWHSADRVYILAEQNVSAEAGLLVLRDPHDKLSVRRTQLGRLKLAERFLTITGSYAESHLYLRRLQGSMEEVRGVLDRLVGDSAEGRSATRGYRPRAWQQDGQHRGTMAFETLEDAQRAHIHAVLEHTNWVIQGPRGAARVLGIRPSTLRSRMEKLGIGRPDHPEQ